MTINEEPEDDLEYLSDIAYQAMVKAINQQRRPITGDWTRNLQEKYEGTVYEKDIISSQPLWREQEFTAYDAVALEEARQRAERSIDMMLDKNDPTYLDRSIQLCINHSAKKPWHRITMPHDFGPKTSTCNSLVIIGLNAAKHALDKKHGASSSRSVG